LKRFKTDTGSNTNPIEARQKIEFNEFELPNGLHCVLHRDINNPLVNVTIGYKVGSKDELPGKQGIAHLFEHMMFQGSRNVKKNEHFQYVMQSGGTCNAFTMHDATVYYDQMPANTLEMALWLESDRMNSLDISEENLSNQKSVVIEEKKQVYENAPYGSMTHNIFCNIFKNSGYESSVIGEAEDINSFSVKEATDFHDYFYSPKNSVLIIAGDIEIEKTKDIINKYFSGINKNGVIQRVKNVILPVEKEIEIEVQDNVQLTMLNICYQIPGAGTKGDYVFEYFCEIIANNKSSRLYKKLVYEKKLLKSVRALKYCLEDRGVLILRAMLNPGVSVDEIRSEIFNCLNELSEKGCSDEEFEKIKNQLEFHNTIEFLKIQNIAVETAFNYMFHKDVSRFNESIHKFLAVSKEDLRDHVKNYITGKNKLVLTYLPKK